MNLHPLTLEGYRLLHHGALELARLEEAGIRIDLQRLEHVKEELGTKIRNIRGELQQSREWTKWRKRYGAKANITSSLQLSRVLVDDLHLNLAKRTALGNVSTDSEALSHIDHPFVRQWSELAKYNKALNTFVRGIEREVDQQGFLHPVFNLHIARTYRSSSDSPNFQNFPVRDKEIAHIIRSLFVARPGCVLVENDFKGIEVCVSACYHKDQNFIDYITTPGKDMHRDMAAQLYVLEPGQVSKDTRYGAKNKFVFPQFYGDFYVSCARALWEWAEKGKLTGPNGETMLEHLRKQGIRELGELDPDEKPRKGTFERHVQEVENDFWNNRFGDYGKWRRQWFKQYLKRGYFDLLSGFRIPGIWPRNAVINYPVQGAAFHCLLWTLIQLNRALRKYRMKSRAVGQIHDSILGDVQENELRDYLCIVEEVVGVRLRKHFDWIVVPMVIEYEICPPGKPWFDKQEFTFREGRFGHPRKQGKWTRDPSRFLDTLQ